ncbi:hypothetical protein [Nocardia sp. NPDC019255]
MLHRTGIVPQRLSCTGELTAPSIEQRTPGYYKDPMHARGQGLRSR